MPEGHVVHRQARQLTRAFRGLPLLVASPQGRFAESARVLDGSGFRGADAHGKHLFLRFADDRWVHVHLGLYGKWTIGSAPPSAPRGQVRLRLVGGDSYADLRGPTACDLVTGEEAAAVIARIGPDPIRRGADPERAWVRLHRSRAPVAAVLMDQTAFAGVGNIYRAEVLYRAGMDPYRPGRDVSRDEFDLVWADLVALMRAGVRRGRIDTVRDEHSPTATGRPPRRDRHGGEVYVYRRAGMPCHVCGTPVRSADLRGRTLYWCPTCQP